MTGIEQIAKELRSRDNIEHIGMVVGRVISANPLEIQITEDIKAKPPNIVCAAGLVFADGDSVIIQASEDNRRFFILAKAVTT